MKRGRETCSQSGRSGAAGAQPTVSRSRPRRARKALRAPLAPAGQGCSAAVAPPRPPCGPRGCLREEDERTPNGVVRNPRKWRASHGTDDRRSARAEGESRQTRHTKSDPQADALLLATIKAVGIVQPPGDLAAAWTGATAMSSTPGIAASRRRSPRTSRRSRCSSLIRADDDGAMRVLVENVAREPLNPVDQWRAIERLVALGWTEEAIGVALAQPVRQVRKLRLLANVLPAMLDQMAQGRHARASGSCAIIASASLEEQKRGLEETQAAARPIRRSRGGASRGR